AALGLSLSSGVIRPLSSMPIPCMRLARSTRLLHIRCHAGEVVSWSVFLLCSFSSHFFLFHLQVLCLGNFLCGLFMVPSTVFGCVGEEALSGGATCKWYLNEEILEIEEFIDWCVWHLFVCMVF